MRFVLPCMECLKQNGEPSMDFSVVEVTDKGVWHLTCSHDHESMVVLQENKFEVLFDMGCMALSEGYTREAISDFAVALERFYEYCLDIFCQHGQVGYDQSRDTWKHISKQSERQLGAFYYAYLLKYKEVPPVIPNKMVELRNKVVHQGYIASREEGFTFGQTVYDYIVELLKVLKHDSESYMLEVTFRRQREAQQHNQGKPMATMSASGVIGLSKADFGMIPFGTAIESINQRPFGIR